MKQSLITKIILLSSVLVLVIFLFQLPKVVVNDKEKVVKSEETKPVQEQEVNHNSFSEERKLAYQRLRAEFENVDNSKFFTTFADSLANLFREAGMFDSVVHYKELAFNKLNTLERKAELADALFTAFEVSPPNIGKAYARRAKKHYEELVEKFPEVDEFKVKQAVLIVKLNAAEGVPPIEGINMLKEIIRNSPDNVLANRQLGEFYMQIGASDPKMIEKATTYFKNILKVDENNLRATINLLECNLALQNKMVATQYMTKLKSIIDMTDPLMKDYVRSKESELNEL